MFFSCSIVDFSLSSSSFFPLAMMLYLPEAVFINVLSDLRCNAVNSVLSVLLVEMASGGLIGCSYFSENLMSRYCTSSVFLMSILSIEYFLENSL